MLNVSDFVGKTIVSVQEVYPPRDTRYEMQRLKYSRTKTTTPRPIGIQFHFTDGSAAFFRFVSPSPRHKKRGQGIECITIPADIKAPNGPLAESDQCKCLYCLFRKTGKIDFIDHLNYFGASLALHHWQDEDKEWRRINLS